MLSFRPFPETFYLTNLASISERACALKVNPHVQHVAEGMRQWFISFKVYDEVRSKAYIERGRFDIFAALSFPDADPQHLETCLAFFYWAFATDDLSDEGELQNQPERVKASIDICRETLYNPDLPTPTYSYAAMLQEFLSAYQAFSDSQINQSLHRSLDKMPSIADFIKWRRATIGAALVEAMVEYSLDLDIPDYVFKHPTVMAMSDATTDIMTWPNDLCSFNKEQADGDFQNLVCIIMAERNLELQDAINALTDMLETRVDEYLALKKSLPSFGLGVDAQLARYHSALEHFVQGTVVWYYMSPRYFSEDDRRKALESKCLLLKLKVAPEIKTD
ncbi:terpenoid synthase [Pholiota conissans]|uniref:Terpene synthase n=1 Tax=Pholiota conissans TaxID=109636 RepID=A0A9P5YV14_9AGAR|nr:terpenoid synthase [Pholiota conissans]